MKAEEKRLGLEENSKKGREEKILEFEGGGECQVGGHGGGEGKQVVGAHVTFFAKSWFQF